MSTATNPGGRRVSPVFLSLGCNVGDCRSNLAAALKRLDGDPASAVARVSSVYITEPVGRKDQPDFMNIAVEITTDREPLELLQLCQAIESELGGREGRVAMGPRTIDIDILMYEGEEMSGPELELPHPRMAERAFVLAPLAEIAPGVLVPGGLTARAAAAELDDRHAVRKNGSLEGYPGG